MEDTEKKYSFVIFGRDILEIPCARKSYLYGISGGVGIGFVSFLLTSRPRLASHIAMGSFCCITMGYWMNCRYNYYLMKQQVEASQRAIIVAEKLQEQAEPLSEVDKGFVSV